LGDNKHIDSQERREGLHRPKTEAIRKRRQLWRKNIVSLQGETEEKHS